MPDNWPKYQHSFFLDEERNGPQTVIRGDDYKLWMEDVNKARKDFGIPPLPIRGLTPVVEDSVTPQDPFDGLLDQEPPAEVQPVVIQTTVREVIQKAEEAAVAEEYWVNESHTEKNPGRHFRIGKKSKKFLGWTDEPLTARK